MGVFIGNTEQISGKTANDFTEDLTYRVNAEDGTHAEYTVIVTLIKELKSVMPHIYIDTDDQAPVNSKKIM